MAHDGVVFVQNWPRSYIAFAFPMPHDNEIRCCLCEDLFKNKDMIRIAGTLSQFCLIIHVSGPHVFAGEKTASLSKINNVLILAYYLGCS